MEYSDVGGWDGTGDAAATAVAAWNLVTDPKYAEALLTIALSARIAKLRNADMRGLFIFAEKVGAPSGSVGWLYNCINREQELPHASGEPVLDSCLSRLHMAAKQPGFASEHTALLRLSREQAITLIPWGSEWYPPNLSAFPQAPPAILYITGDAYREAICSPFQLSVVGSRKATSYGYQFLRTQTPALAAEGFNIISGLARGIDGAAHREIMHAGGTTLAVVGHGLDMCYPPEHRDLMRKIKAQGAVISEYLPGTELKRNSFPARNRILAGIGQATFVVEADTRSGAMITANQAVEGGRDVFALPGSVDAPLSRGCLDLICEGAIPVRHSGDIVTGMGQYSETPFNLQYRRDAFVSAEKTEGLPDGLKVQMEPLERNILQTLRQRTHSVDQLAAALNEPLIPVMLTLTALEMRGLVSQMQGLYALTSDGYSSI